MVAAGTTAAIVATLLVAAMAVLLFICAVRRGAKSSRLMICERESTRHQVAALPVRRGSGGRLEVLVVSTRGSGRWTIPKGWPMNGLSDADAAAQEASEEAGVCGIVSPEPIGSFVYAKRTRRNPLLVTVYRLDVDRHLGRWPEQRERKRRWLAAQTAAKRVAWEGLADVIRSLVVSVE
jgi:8-oxo-dGTP pyrophosphatase MutT (NUDIX family)